MSKRITQEPFTHLEDTHNGSEGLSPNDLRGLSAPDIKFAEDVKNLVDAFIDFDAERVLKDPGAKKAFDDWFEKNH